MSTAAEQFLEQFLEWERLGRGGLPVMDAPVCPEPPFREFSGYRKPVFVSADDGVRKRSAFGGFALPAVEAEVDDEEEGDDLDFDLGDAPLTVELTVLFRVGEGMSIAEFLPVLRQIADRVATFGFEVLGTSEAVVVQLVCSEEDEGLLTDLVGAHVPGATVIRRTDSLVDAWVGKEDEGEDKGEDQGRTVSIFECGLRAPFVVPMRSPVADPLIGIVGALVQLREGEVGVFQVLVCPARRDWGGSIERLFVDGGGSPVFSDGEAMHKASRVKVSQPLFGVVVRLAVKSSSSERCGSILKGLGAPLNLFWSADGNGFEPLGNGDYPMGDHEGDLLRRQSRRFGMLLAEEEVLGLVHLPPATIEHDRFERITRTTRLAPEALRSESVDSPLSAGLHLGINEHAGKSYHVWLGAEHRTRHLHIAGASGTGKTTLLFQMIRDDIEKGRGVALLDPHGDLVHRLMAVIPEERLDDLVLFDPDEPDASVGLNILSAYSEQERLITASDLVSIFRRLSTTWGDQMNVVLRCAIMAFLDHERGGHLGDLKRFLIDDDFRADYVAGLRDPELKDYWQKVYPKIKPTSSTNAVVARLQEFLTHPTMRSVIARSDNTLDLGAVMDGGKILLARISQSMGSDNASLLGSLIISKIQQVAIARFNIPEEEREDFFCYADEFQNFVTPSMEPILNEARKLRVGLVLAHQQLGQLDLDPKVARAVKGIGTRIVFRIDYADAKPLASRFKHFDAEDLQSLEKGEAVCAVERSDHDFNLQVPFPDYLDAESAELRKQQVLGRLREKRVAESAEMEPEGTVAADAAVEAARTSDSSAEPAVVPAVEVPDEEVQSVAGAGEVDQAEKKDEAIPEQTSAKREHEAIKDEIVRVAHAAGYRADPERKTEDGGRIDVVCENGARRIAFEVASTSPVEAEIEHLHRGLAAGYREVVSVVDSKRKRKLMRTRCAEEFSGDEVHVLAPGDIGAFLRRDEGGVVVGSGSEEAAPAGDKIGGYLVRHQRTELEEGARLRREAELLKILEEAMRGDGG